MDLWNIDPTTFPRSYTLTFTGLEPITSNKLNRYNIHQIMTVTFILTNDNTDSIDRCLEIFSSIPGPIKLVLVWVHSNKKESTHTFFNSLVPRIAQLNSKITDIENYDGELGTIEQPRLSIRGTHYLRIAYKQCPESLQNKDWIGNQPLVEKLSGNFLELELDPTHRVLEWHSWYSRDTLPCTIGINHVIFIFHGWSLMYENFQSLLQITNPVIEIYDVLSLIYKIDGKKLFINSFFYDLLKDLIDTYKINEIYVEKTQNIEHYMLHIQKICAEKRVILN